MRLHKIEIVVHNVVLCNCLAAICRQRLRLAFHHHLAHGKRQQRITPRIVGNATHSLIVIRNLEIFRNFHHRESQCIKTLRLLTNVENGVAQKSGVDYAAARRKMRHDILHGGRLNRHRGQIVVRLIGDERHGYFGGFHVKGQQFQCVAEDVGDIIAQLGEQRVRRIVNYKKQRNFWRLYQQHHTVLRQRDVALAKHYLLKFVGNLVGHFAVGKPGKRRRKLSPRSLAVGEIIVEIVENEIKIFLVLIVCLEFFGGIPQRAVVLKREVEVGGLVAHLVDDGNELFFKHFVAKVEFGNVEPDRHSVALVKIFGRSGDIDERSLARLGSGAQDVGGVAIEHHQKPTHLVLAARQGLPHPIFVNSPKQTIFHFHYFILTI